MFSAINRTAKRWVIRQIKRRPVVLISDTTLRDGIQMPGVRVTAEGRVRIALALEGAGIHSIDVGFPAAGPDEVQSIQLVAEQVKGPVLSALARTKREDIDLAAEALERCPIHKKAVTLFIGTSPMHREHKHRLTKSQTIDKATEAVSYAQEHFQVISFGAEDASRTEPEFLHEIYDKVIQAGATSIGFADTIGMLSPNGVTRAIDAIHQHVSNIDRAFTAVHFHNDLGLGTANALAAIHAGANIVQGTINGIGERAGNVALEEVVLALKLHADEFGKTVNVDTACLSSLSALVAELTGWQPAANKPVVGRNMFRTEAGIHQDGFLKHPETYLPFQPELIGAGPVELVLGPSSGRSAVRHHLRKNGLEPDEALVQRLLAHLKSEKESPIDDVELAGAMDLLKDHLALSAGRTAHPSDAPA